MAASTVLTFAPSRDATVRADRPDRNYGTDATLGIDASPQKRTYLGFSLNGIGQDRVESAVLRLYNVDGSPVGGVLQPAVGSWDELTVTWNHQPSLGSPVIASLGKVAPGTWYELNMTPVVTGDGSLDLVLTSSSANGADYSSRESGATTAPQLVVTTRPAQPPDGEPPSQPQGLTATADSASRVTLAWTPSTDNVGVAAYDIVRNGTPLTSTSSAGYTDTGVIGQTTYQYTVTARDAAGNVSPPSDLVEVTTPAGAPVLVGAGDIATCTGSGDEATATLLDAQPGTVITLGDNAYENGTSQEFADCYQPGWGRHLARTMPATGNHDYNTPGAAGYYAYFGAVGGDPAKGWYAYTRGTWRIIVLNSNCAAVGGCGFGSAQDLWLQSELAAHADMNVLAYWHHPRFSSGTHGDDPTFDAFWQRLYDAGADLILNGHDHDYERFAPQAPPGALDLSYGIREFVVGTGGVGLGTPGSGKVNSEVWSAASYGVLKLTLNPGSYEWQFLPVAGGTFTDSGQTPVHPAPPADGAPPSIPTGLRATSITATQVVLGWDAASDNMGVTAYEVSRDGQRLGQSVSRQYIDSSVLAGMTYGYAVRARDAAGNWSEWSAPLWVSTPSPPSSLTLELSADATIRADKLTANYGSAITIETDASPQKNIMLRAVVGDLSGYRVVSATLYLYCVDASDSGGVIYRAGSAWTESSVTWATAPAPEGAAIASVGAVSVGSWYQFDLTSVITGTGSYSFRVSSTSANGADYTSREGSAGFRPTLVLQLAPA